MTLTFDLEGQDHILFLRVDYVGLQVKINSLGPIVIKISWLKCICIMIFISLTMKVNVTLCLFPIVYYVGENQC